MIKSILLALVILLTVKEVNAQVKDSLLKIYNEKSIHSFGNVFIMGSQQLKFRDLKSELTSPITKPLYRKSKANLTLTWVFTTTAIAGLVTGIVIRKNSPGWANVFSVAAIGLNLGSLHFRKKSTELVDRAIWYRNKETLFNTSE
ncbi:MAG: hypothetical protein ABIR15_06295 [Chitinophagaceae bacterium]